MLKAFQLHQPRSVPEVIEMRTRFGEQGVLYAGGTELLLVMKLGLAHWGHLIDVKRVPGLDEISEDTTHLWVGASATHRDISRDHRVRRCIPVLAELESRIANVRVRAAGTLAGNLAFGEPHADPPTLLTALAARVRLAGPTGEREVPIERFQTGAYETALEPSEMIVSIGIPKLASGTRAAYVNFRVLERPTIGVAAVAQVSGGRFSTAPHVVIGAVDDVPRRIYANGLVGTGSSDRDALDQFIDSAKQAIEPGEDLAGSVEYKRHVAGVLVRRALGAIMAQSAA